MGRKNKQKVEQKIFIMTEHPHNNMHDKPLLPADLTEAGRHLSPQDRPQPFQTTIYTANSTLAVWRSATAVLAASYRTPAAVLPNLQGSQTRNLAIPHPSGFDSQRHSMGPAVHCCLYRLIGLVVKASTSRVAHLGSIPAFGVDLFSRSSHISDLKIGNPVATLPGAWH